MSKAAKLRACPAVGRQISSAECGANRVSRYACPASCSHLPFAPANYSQLLELEEKLDRLSMDYLRDTAVDPEALTRGILQARHNPNWHAFQAFYEWNLFFARDADGRTCAERWEQSATADFKNDERVLLRAKMQKRVALIEIRCVLDSERIDAVDLLAPGEPALRLHDRSLSSMAVRFAAALVWAYPLPHYWRMSGTAILIPEMAQFEPREIVTEIAAQLGGPVTERELRLWLAENFVRFDEALAATCRQRRLQMLAGLDAKAGKALYELQAPFAPCRSRLDELPLVEPDRLSPQEQAEGFAEARIWFANPSETNPGGPPGAQAALGRILLGQAHWRLEAFGAENLARLRQQFETQLGQRARFSGERLDNLSVDLAAKEPAVDESLVPPRLLQDPQQFRLTASRVPAPPPGVPLAQLESEFYRNANRQFLEDKIPALDNHTPREAARDPALRPRLLRLLKQRVRSHDEHNLRTGGNDDINWLLRELGADEILFPPPPLRPATEPILREESEVEDYPFAGNPDLPPAPQLPAEPLSAEEAASRLDRGMAAFATAAEALDSLAACGLTLFDDADELTVDWLNEDEYGFAIAFILEAALAFVPPGHRAPITHYDSLEEIFNSNLAEILASFNANKPDAIMACLATCTQPQLMLLLATQILKGFLNGPKDLHPRLEAQPVILALVKSVIEELDRVLRPGGAITEI